MATPSAQPLITPSPRTQAIAALTSPNHQDIELRNYQPETNTRSGSLSPVSNTTRNSIDGSASTDNADSLLGNKSSFSLGIQEKANINSSRPIRFDRRRQLKRLIIEGLAHYIITIGLICGLYGTLKIYLSHGIIYENGKKVFNTLMTGLSMALGISIASSFKSVALSVRWCILSRKRRPIEEVCIWKYPSEHITNKTQVEAILSCSSLTEVSKLAATSLRKMKPGIAISCISWVLLNIVRYSRVQFDKSTKPTLILTSRQHKQQ
jgi:hypothetical protein